MSFTYRIVRRTLDPIGDLPPATDYGIYEVYSDGNGGYNASTVNFIGPYGETLQELQLDLNNIIRAASLPVLEWNDTLKCFIELDKD